MADQKEESWFSVGLSDGKQDDRGLAYRTALMFSDGYISFCYFNILHSSIFYGFYHFLTTLEVDPTTIALWCVVVALVPLLFEIRPLLHKTDAFSHFIPFFALLFHGLSAIPHPRARSVLSIVAGAFALAHFITRVSRPPNDPVAQRTYGAYALGLLGQVIVRIGALSMAPALYMVIPIACAGLLAAAVLWREARIESRASKARVEAGETMVPLRASSIASKGSFMFIPTGAALAFWLIMMLSLVTWPGVALRLGGVDVYPTVLLPLFALGAGIFLPMLLRNHAFAKKIVRARNAGTAVASTGALFAVLGALLIYRNDSPTWMILGSMGVCFGTGPLLFSILHELVRLGTLQAAGRTMAFGLLIFIFWLPYYAGYTYGGYEYQSAGIYHRHLRNTLTTAMAEDDIPGFGLAVLLPIALCAAMTILIEIVRADHPGRGVQIRRVVQRLPMLRTAREMTSTLVIVLLLVFLPSVLVNAFLSPVHEKRIIDGQLTVMSVNVHQGYQLAGGDGYEGHHNVARLYDAIIKHDPDIVAIQGSNGLPFISGAIDIPHYLSRAAGMYAYTNNTLDDTLGVAFLTRRPLNNVSFWADAADARRAIGAATLLVSEVPVRLYVGGPQLRQFVTTQTPIRNDIAAGHPVLAFFDVSDEPRENEAELRAALGYNETTAGVTTPGDLGLLLASNTSWPARVARSAVHWRQVSTADYDTAIGSTTPASTAPSSSGAQDLLRCNSFGSIANSGDGFSATGSIAIASTADNKLVATFSDITVKQGSDVAVGTFMGHAHVASCADGGGAHWQVDENGPADATNELWLPMTNLTASNQPYSTTSPAVSGDGDVNGIKSFVIHQMSTDEHDHDGHHHDDKRVCCDLTPVNSAAQTTENNAVGSMPYTVSKLSLVGVDSLPYEEFETDGVPPGGYQELAASLWIIGCFVLVVLVVAFIYSRNALGLDGSFGSWDEPEVQSSNNQINNANNNTTELKQIENDDDDEVDPDVVGAEKREKKSSKSNEKKSNKSTTETPKKVEKAKPSEEEEEEYEYEYEYETETVEPSTDDAKPVEKTTKTAAKDQSDTETGTEASYEYEYETETGQESEEVEYEYEYVTVSDDEVEKK